MLETERSSFWVSDQNLICRRSDGVGSGDAGPQAMEPYNCESKDASVHAQAALGITSTNDQYIDFQEGVGLLMKADS